MTRFLVVEMSGPDGRCNARYSIVEADGVGAALSQTHEASRNGLGDYELHGVPSSVDRLWVVEAAAVTSIPVHHHRPTAPPGDDWEPL